MFHKFNLLVSGLILFAVGCQETPLERKADQVRDQSQQQADNVRESTQEQADAIRENAKRQSENNEARADQVEEKGERTADAIEEQSISRFGEGVFDWYGLAIKTIGRMDQSQFLAGRLYNFL